MQCLFFLGRAHALASAEMRAVLSARYPAAVLSVLSDDLLLVDGITEADARLLQSLFGGVVKVAIIDQVIQHADRDVLEKSAAALLQKLAGDKNKIAFGIAEIGRDTLPALRLHTIKTLLADQSLRTRFVDGVRSGLSASVLLHQNVEECVVVRSEEKTYVGYTIAVQDIDAWSMRDRAKPAADRKHGMLPPKVARMMLNLALPAGIDGKCILDPFCGTGTVLLEAMLLGAHAIGSDLRIEAVGQTQKNCAWLASEVPLTGTFETIVADATHISSDHVKRPVDAIVAEGFLGAQTPRPGAVPNQMKGLEKLYRGAFKQWRTILADHARVCIALPRITSGKTIHSLSSLVDSLSEYGYTTISGSYIYDRPGAIVSREIFVLEYRK